MDIFVGKFLLWLAVGLGLASITCYLVGFCFLIIGAIFFRPVIKLRNLPARLLRRHLSKTGTIALKRTNR